MRAGKYDIKKLQNERLNDYFFITSVSVRVSACVCVSVVYACRCLNSERNPTNLVSNKKTVWFI